MGRCVQIGGQPPPVDIQLPGGVKISSMAQATQQVPNAMDPFQTLLQGAQPALGSVKPVFDIIGFVMQLMETWTSLMKILASFAPLFPPLAPLAVLFPPPPKIDEDTGEPVEPREPDLGALLPGFFDSMVKMFAKALKLAGLVPQISAAVTVKDSIITAMGFADAAMAQVNSLTDVFDGLPSPSSATGTSAEALQCAADGSLAQLEHKLGPLSNLVPLFSVLSLIAEAASQPLPRAVYDMFKLMAMSAPDGFGVINFPDLGPGLPTPEEQRDQILSLIEEMTISGLPIEIPDLGDMSVIGETMSQLKAQVEPILPAIEMLQDIFNKLTEA